MLKKFFDVKCKRQRYGSERYYFWPDRLVLRNSLSNDEMSGVTEIGRKTPGRKG